VPHWVWHRVQQRHLRDPRQPFRFCRPLVTVDTRDLWHEILYRLFRRTWWRRVVAWAERLGGDSGLDKRSTI